MYILKKIKNKNKETTGPGVELILPQILIPLNTQLVSMTEYDSTCICNNLFFPLWDMNC